jgi:hypothetical protein
LNAIAVTTSLCRASCWIRFRLRPRQDARFALHARLATAHDEKRTARAKSERVDLRQIALNAVLHGASFVERLPRSDRHCSPATRRRG